MMIIVEGETKSIIPEGAVKIRDAKVTGREFREGLESYATIEVFMHETIDFERRYYSRETVHHGRTKNTTVYEATLDSYGHAHDAMAAFVLNHALSAARP